MECCCTVCRCLHLRNALVACVVALLFSLLVICYSLMATHHQTMMPHLDGTLILTSGSRADRFTDRRLYSILHNNTQEDVRVKERPPNRGDSVINAHDLHQCRVKVILNEVGHLDQQKGVISQCSRVIYNRVPKCGSRTVLGTFKSLSAELNYSLVSVARPSKGKSFLKETDLLSFVENFTEFQSPLLYSQHLHYVDFTRFHRENPLYINVIRDPVERQISHFYYNKFGSSNSPKTAVQDSDGETIDSCMESGTGFCVKLNAMLPFFCGQDKMCRTRSTAALKKAKRIASENVLVIGFTEDLPSFMEVLEFILPNYFANASSVFRDISVKSYNRTKTAVKPFVKPETRRKLRDHLSLEYDFYNFAKQRFYNLLQRVRRAKTELGLTPLYRNKRDFFKWWSRQTQQT